MRRVRDRELDQRDLVRVVVINGQPVDTCNTVVLLAEGSATSHPRDHAEIVDQEGLSEWDSRYRPVGP